MYCISPIENVNRIHILFEFFSSVFRSRDIQLLMKKIFPVFGLFFVFKKAEAIGPTGRVSNTDRL